MINKAIGEYILENRSNIIFNESAEGGRSTYIVGPFAISMFYVSYRGQDVTEFTRPIILFFWCKDVKQLYEQGQISANIFNTKFPLPAEL